MKLTSIEIHPQGSPLVFDLSFRDPAAENPYNVKGIVGLDAESIVPKRYGGSGNTPFYNMTLGGRNVIFRIGLNPNFADNKSYSDLRDDLYRAVASSRTGLVDIQFKNDSTVVAVLSGFILKLEAPNFEKIQEVQLTVVPPENSMLRAPVAVDVDISELDPALTTISDPLSTAWHGFDFQVAVVGGLASLHVTNPYDASWGFTVTPLSAFVDGDVIHYSSDPTNKQLYVVRGGTTIYLADAVVPGSIWPIIFPGDNPLAFDNPTNLMWVAISHYPTYWGV